MFDIGFWELVLISVVGLVVLGPERLPTAIRSVSRFISSAKSMANNVKDELSHELKVQELQDNLRKAEKMGMEDLSPELKSSVEELKRAAQDVTRPYAKDKVETTEEASSVAADVKPAENESPDKKVE
ncbi:twin arginine-targeting protein translocase TatB [Vibrio sp. 10N.286.49.C2]|uniref:Sec-independent protein translocase protein TatB n=1 Tax=unclassified Vibrio TaxID=2614977 RepID=UPI000C81921E|nr:MULTISPECIES: Sec-independent protein translocase protein TatB [unclassified Vibrio]PMH37382.1 twin arginine-targeting protein translocase TatB [Vibrio sp. 10N.286.49.C2]PMH49470.1 twin arginine-targeting protein translocase TatB [Vibrio sp. 10N.286.49.B1]PMH83845.1 twin arginine-targeting protein translocase TatB [Vibrio sp. 10N.286.48.B7]